MTMLVPTMLVPTMRRPLDSADRLLFIHIPKTAGTTMNAFLDQQFEPEAICPAEQWEDLILLPPDILETFRLFRGHFFYELSQRLPQPPVVVTMLRDPVAQLLSIYKFWRTIASVTPGVNPYEDMLKARALQLDFDGFVRDPDVAEFIQNQQTHRLGGIPGRPDHQYSRAVMVEIALERLDRFAVVGLAERFDDALALLCYRFGWKPVQTVQPLMVSPQNLTPQDLSRSTIDYLLDLNRYDQALYEKARSIFERHFADMVYELNDAVFVRHFMETHPPQGAVDFRFDRALVGANWHLREGVIEEGRVIRWMGPGRISTIDFHLKPDCDLSLYLRIVNTPTLEIARSLRVRANATWIPLQHTIEGNVHHYGGRIPRQALNGGFTRLSFEVSRTVSLQSLDPTTDDRRPVGLAFNRIVLSPIADSQG